MKAGGSSLLHTFYLRTAAHGGKHRPMATKGGNNILYLFMVAVQHWEISLRHCTDNEKQGLLNSRATPLFKHLQRVFLQSGSTQLFFSITPGPLGHIRLQRMAVPFLSLLWRATTPAQTSPQYSKPTNRRLHHLRHSTLWEFTLLQCWEVG